MNIRTPWIAALAACLLATSASAQTNFPEVEPNSIKSEANPVVGIVAGDTITGLSTGQTTTAGATTSVTADVYRVKTGFLPLGIYQHRLTLTTSGTAGHTTTIRGVTQTGTPGTASTGGTATTVDTQAQMSSTTSTPPRFNQWYAFGKGEEIYYRVAGTTATTGGYTATMSTTPVSPTLIAQPFESGAPITITSVAQTTANTMIHVFDSNLNAIPGYSNNDEGPDGTTTQSRLTRTFPAGTYYMSIAFSNTAWNIPSPPDEDAPNGILLDFQGSLVCATTLTIAQDFDFFVIGANGAVFQTAQLPAGFPYEAMWFQFTTAPGAAPISTPPPANDNCAAATALPATAATLSGALLGATNDGSASCDPGGASSRDVWYSWTNPNASARLLTVTTCTTTGVNDTALSVYNACGGLELACSDDCGGTPCSGPTSCITGLSVNPSQTVLIRVSDKGLGGAALGDFTIKTTITIPPPSNDLCSTPLPIAGLGTFAVSNAGATTGTEGQSEVSCLFFTGMAIRQDMWFTWLASNSGAITLTTCGLFTSGSADTKIAVYDGAGCPTAAAIACNDNQAPACLASGLASTLTFNAVCGNTYTFQFGMTWDTASVYTGSLSVTGGGPDCNSPSVPECIGDTVAACPCSGPGGSLIPNAGAPGNGCANSTFPAGANLSSTGFALDNAGDTLVLICSNMPGPGLFVQANSLAGPIVNFNDGILCAAVGIIRMGVVFPDGSGVASYPGGLTPAPIHVAGGPVLLGGSPTPETKHYQCWYRDITVGFCNTLGHNMSNGLAIVWAP